MQSKIREIRVFLPAPGHVLRSYERVKFYISGANVPGEGELKCIDWLKLTLQKGSEEDAVIVGGDADLILQGLALPEVISQQRISSIWIFIQQIPIYQDCYFLVEQRERVAATRFHFLFFLPCPTALPRPLRCSLPLPGEESFRLFSGRHRLLPPVVVVGGDSLPGDAVSGPVGLRQD